MQPNPTKVNNSEEKDYQTIYQDNFVKRNDPAVLGTAAINRQMSQGISNKLNGGPSMTAVTSGVECAPGYVKNERGVCVLESRAAVTNYNEMRQDAITTQKYNNMFTGYGRSGDLGALESAGVEVVTGPSLPNDEEEETNTETETKTVVTRTDRGSVFDSVNAEVERLTGLLDDEGRYLNDEFNRYYNELVRQAEGRAAREGTSPFTGGIARQIEDYMSAAEIEALGRLKMEKDRQNVDLEQRKQNVRTQAIRNVLEQKAGEMQTVAQNLEYTQQLAQYVLDGQLSVQDALRLGDELGLGDINELMASAVKKQIAAGTITEAEAKKELENSGFDPTIIDDDGEGGGPVNTEEGNLEAANKFRAELETVLGETSATFDEMFSVVSTQVISGALAGAGIGLIGGATAIPGAIIGGVFGLATGLTTALGTTQVDARDLPTLYNGILESGILTQSFYEGTESDIGVQKQPSANNTITYLDDSFTITVGSNEPYSFDGVELLTLATVLKRAGLSDNPDYQAIFTEAEKIYQRGMSGVSFSTYLGTRASNAYKIYETVFNK